LNTTKREGGACALTDRLRRDSSFRTLLENDTQAALQAAGISVPSGVQVRYARDAAMAVQMTLDGAPAQTERSLSDAELMGVAGGVRSASDNAEDIQRFLSASKRRVS